MAEGLPEPGRVLVTGISSFIGAHLAVGFRRAGHVVVGTFSRPLAEYDDTQRSRIEHVRLHGARLRTLDLANPAQVREAVAQERPTVWVQHAGWATNYAAADYDLDAGLRVNVLALDCVYAALAGTECRGVLVTGSSAEYADSDVANREADTPWPATPYGLAKLAETLRARQLAIGTNVPTRVARVYIPFGALDNPGKLLASVVDSLKTRRPVPLSPCTQARDFIHVDELVRGYVALAADLSRPTTLFDVFNLCAGRATELRSFVLAICDRLGAPRELLQFGAREMRPGEPAVSFGDNSRAREILGWAPSDLQTGIDRLIGRIEVGTGDNRSRQ